MSCFKHSTKFGGFVPRIWTLKDGSDESDLRWHSCSIEPSAFCLESWSAECRLAASVLRHCWCPVPSLVFIEGVQFPSWCAALPVGLRSQPQASCELPFASCGNDSVPTIISLIPKARSPFTSIRQHWGWCGLNSFTGCCFFHETSWLNTGRFVVCFREPEKASAPTRAMARAKRNRKNKFRLTARPESIFTYLSTRGRLEKKWRGKYPCL